MAVDMGSAVGRIQLDFSQLSSALATAQAQTKSAMDGIKQSSEQAGQSLSKSFEQAGQKMQSIGQGLTGAGTAMTKAFTVPLTAFGVLAGKSALDFETSMAKVGTIADGTQKPLSSMEKEVRNVAKTYGTSASEISEATYQAISAGVDTGKSVAFVGEMNKLAIGGFTDVTTAVDTVTTVMNAYGLEAEDAGHISDVLIQTQNKGKTSVDELSGSIGKLIPIADANSVSVEQLGQAYSVMTANGVKTAESTTMMKALFGELGKEGSQSADILQQQTGKSFKELSDDGVSLRDVLQTVSDGAAAQGKSFEGVFSSSEAAGAGLVLLNTEQDAYNASLQEFVNASGDTNKAYQTMADTSGQKLAVAIQTGKDALITFGSAILDAVMPAIQGLGDAIAGAAEWFSGLSQPMRGVIVGVGLVVAAIGPFLAIVGSVTTSVGKGIEALGKFSNFLKTDVATWVANTTARVANNVAVTAGIALYRLETAGKMAASAITGVMTGQITLYTAAQWLANAALTAFPVVAVIAGIAALAVGIVALVKHLNSSSEAYKQNKKDVEDLGSAQDQLESDIEASSGAFDGTTTAINANAKAGQNLVGRLKDISNETLSAEEKSRKMQNVISQLNGTVDGLNVAYDEQTGKITDVNTGNEVTIDQIQQLTDATAELAQAEAWQERQIELNGELARAQEEQIVIMNKIDDINANQDMNSREKEKLIQELQTTYDAYGATIEDVNGRITIAEEQAMAVNSEMAQSVVDGFGKVGGAVDTVAPTLDSLAEKYGMTTTEIQSQLDSQNISIEQWASAQEQATVQAAEATAQYAEKVINDFEAVPTSMSKSADEITATLLKNAEDMAAWESNMAKLSEAAGTEGAAAVQALQDMGTKSSEVVAEMLQDPEKLTSYVEAFNDAGKGASEQFSQGIETISTVTPPSVEGGITKAVAAADAKVAEFQTEGQKSGESYAQGLSTGMQQATTETQTAGTNISTALQTTTTAATTEGTATGTGYSTGIAVGLQTAQTEAQTAGAAISTTLTQTTADATTQGTAAGQGYTTSLTTSLAGATTATQTATSGAVQQAQQSATDLTTAGQTAGQGYSTGLTQGMATASQAVGTAITGIIGAAQVGTQGMTQAGQTAGQGFANGLKAGMATATKAVSIATTGIVGAAKVATTGMTQSGQQAGKGYSTGIKSGMATTTSNVQTELNKAKTVATTFTATMKTQGQQAGRGYTDAMKSGLAPMATNIQSEFNKAKTTATSFVSAMKTAGQQAGRGLADAFKVGIAGLSSSLQSELNQAKSAISSFGSSATATMRSAGSSMAQAVSSGFSSAGGWSSLGSSVASGIASGISAGSGAIKSAAVSAAQSALSAAKAALDINSPSGVMRDEVGRWIPAGIADGMERAMPQATRDMQAALTDGTESLNTDVEVDILSELGDTFISVYDRIRSLVEASNQKLQDSIHELSQFSISGGAIQLQAQAGQQAQIAGVEPQQQAGDTFVFNETGLDPQQVARLIRAVKRDMELGFA